MKLFHIIPILFLSSALAWSQTTWYVPDNFPAGIQSAISSPSVVNGDTIIVRSGTYVENIDFLGKAIRVKSEFGPSVTTIDGGLAGSVVTFNSGEGTGSVLEGFTITNGVGSGGPFGGSGGGIACTSTCYPTIKDNVITGNSAVFDGGGILCDGGAAPTITGNTIMDNTAGTSGGGIRCSNTASALITNNTIESNSSTSGGGIMCYDASPNITGNTIKDNSAVDWGGGIRCMVASPVIEANIIVENTATEGGGIRCGSNSSPFIAANIISENSADDGAGISCYYDENYPTSPTITNNMITVNTASQYGGGILFEYSNSIVTCNTIFGNTAGWYGGGICCLFSDSPTVCNTILWNNSAPSGPQISLQGNTALSISYSDVEGGQSQVYTGYNTTLTWGAGMIDSDPLFAGCTGGDFHLTINSPCRDAGSNSASGMQADDCEGDPRIVHATVDIGADEYYYHLYCIGAVVPGGNISIRTVGLPGRPVRLYLSSGIQNPPQSTQYGDLHLQPPPTRRWNLGSIPSSGILFWDITVPGGLSSGSQYHFQALVGPLGNSKSRLTNLMTLTVE